MTAEIRPGYIGARINRFEDARLLVGAGSFVDNRQVSGLLHVALKRSDQPHARILGCDTSGAAEMPGVVGVFTAQDLEGMITPIRATSRMKGYQSTLLHALATDKFRYVGEPVVAVVAENRYMAEDAVEKIVVECEPLPSLIDPEKSAGKDAALLHEEMASNILAVREFTRGDVDGVMAGAAIKVGGRFRFHRRSPVAPGEVRWHKVAAKRFWQHKYGFDK